VPRIGLTKRIEKVNFKLLYSSSFKAPSIENVETSLYGKIKPEKTSIWEFETSWQMNKDMFVTMNLFDITTHNTIVYFVDTSATLVGPPDGYINSHETGSQGIELEYKYLSSWGYTDFSYSFYTNANKSMAKEYKIPGVSNQSLAFPNSKITLGCSINLGKKFFVSPSLLYYSSKWGVVGIDDEENYIYRKFSSSFYSNLFFGYKSSEVNGLKVMIGVNNLFNQKTIFIQPYNSGHAPLPGISREFLISLKYDFQL
jgi:outer membrane receptor protein involved in Fe transport